MILKLYLNENGTADTEDVEELEKYLQSEDFQVTSAVGMPITGIGDGSVFCIIYTIERK